MGFVPVINTVGVEELAYIVGAVPSVLKPHREIVVVETLVDELGIAACMLPLAITQGLWLGRVVRGKRWGSKPHGGERSVTFVLCAALPVHMLTLEGQHSATVQ
jgi:hypothetical protein